MKVAGCGYDHVPGTCDPTEHAMATRLAAANSCLSPCLGALSNTEDSRRGAPRANTIDCRLGTSGVPNITHGQEWQLALLPLSGTSHEWQLALGLLSEKKDNCGNSDVR